jgi:small GTP-binding protein
MEARRKLRLVLLGDFKVGKTSLLRQFLDRKFVEQPSNTQLEDERTTVLKLGGGGEVELLLTDTAGSACSLCQVAFFADAADPAGQEQFRSFTSSYFRDKDGYVVVFSVTDAASFRNLSHWMKEIRGWDEACRVCVVGNKIDCEERAVSTREAEEYVASLGGGAVYLECSAKLNINCGKAFEEMARMCLKSMEPDKGSTPTTAPVNLRDPPQPPEQKNFACCN